VALHWFTSLEGESIHTWDQKKESFSNKYCDYCKAIGTQDEIFGMTQHANESLEGCVEHFQFSYKWSTLSIKSRLIEIGVCERCTRGMDGVFIFDRCWIHLPILL